MVEFLGDDLPYGSYRVMEQSAPTGYLKDTSVQTVEWTGTKDIVLTFENVREPSLTIIKADAQTGVSLPGASFDVYADGKFITSVTTNDAGEAYVTGITQEAGKGHQPPHAAQGALHRGSDVLRHGVHQRPVSPAYGKGRKKRYQRKQPHVELSVPQKK